jgi:hypothetical protein
MNNAVEVVATTHSATMNILLCMVKILEEAGAMKAEDFEGFVRIVAERTAREKSQDVAMLMLEFADQLSCTPRGKPQ